MCRCTQYVGDHHRFYLVSLHPQYLIRFLFFYILLLSYLLNTYRIQQIYSNYANMMHMIQSPVKSLGLCSSPSMRLSLSMCPSPEIRQQIYLSCTPVGYASALQVYFQALSGSQERERKREFIPGFENSNRDNKEPLNIT